MRLPYATLLMILQEYKILLSLTISKVVTQGDALQFVITQFVIRNS